jgi:hypothetical protein
MKIQTTPFWARLGLSSTLLTLIFLGSSYAPEEGMFPLNYLNINNLKESGLKLNAEDIFNPGKVSLTDALVNVGGCTGSFISEDGLIITNHHCVYGNVARLSTAQSNYLEKGFVAHQKEQELPISMPCKITQSYEDVSSQVLMGTQADQDPSARIATIGKNIQRILAQERKKFPELTIEISEMFVGKSYTLFRYVFLKDVRLVMAPPVTVGQFGGDSDNWEWPRHNGDFSLVRAYVGKDGKPAAYSKENIPYTPKKILSINPKGTQEGDFVFIMGYPGRTFRHESGSYLRFQKEVQLPTIQDFYKNYIQWMKELSADNTAKRLAFAGTIQSMENVEKNYRGKIQGLRRTDIVDIRESQDFALKTSYKKGSADGTQANKVVQRIQELWKTRTQLGETYFYGLVFPKQSTAFLSAEFSRQTLLALESPDIRKNKKFQDTLIAQFQTTLLKNYPLSDVELDKRAFEKIMKGLIANASKTGMWKDKTALLTDKKWNQLREDIFFNNEKMIQLLKKNPKKVLELTKKSWVQYLVGEVDEYRLKTSEIWKSTELELSALMPQYIGFREDFLQSQFIPDANSTLRLTHGYIKGYKPNDGEYHSPYTSLEGIFEKANTREDYRLPEDVQDKLRQKNIPTLFKDPKTGKVVVALLYNMDTTGGNSGSPVLNEKGELIGINFDRSFTATINDYAWNEDYSRSIGCDIRYVLYVLKYVSEAEGILKELKINW